MRISKIYYIQAMLTRLPKRHCLQYRHPACVRTGCEIAAAGESLAKQAEEVYENLQNLKF